jgi:hypothetical protein
MGFGVGILPCIRGSWSLTPETAMGLRWACSGTASDPVDAPNNGPTKGQCVDKLSRVTEIESRLHLTLQVLELDSCRAVALLPGLQGQRPLPLVHRSDLLRHQLA